MTAPTPGQPLSEADVSLLPCPFCGGEAFERGFRRYECKNCGAEGPGAGTKAEAIAAWNRRPHAPVSRPGDGVEGERIDYLRRSRDGHARNAHVEFEKRVMATEALISAREALHQHYVDWDGEPEDAVPLQEARDECDRVLDAIAALTPPAEPVSRPAGEGEREAVARLERLCAGWSSVGSAEHASAVALVRIADVLRVLSLLKPGRLEVVELVRAVDQTLDAAAEYLAKQYGNSFGLDHPTDRARIKAALQQEGE